MKLRSALLAATVMVAPVAAQAQAVSGLYIGAGAGANIMQNETVDRVAIPRVANGSISSFNNSNYRLDTGFVGVASIGYGLGNGLRFEIEGDYRQNKLDGFTSSNQRFYGGGDEQKYGGMFNVLYDLDLQPLGITLPVVPYVGLGVGYMWVQEHNSRFTGYNGPAVGAPLGYTGTFRSNEGFGALAAQAIVGASLPIAAVPGLALTAEYRFMALAQSRTYSYQYIQTAPAPGLETRARIKLSDDYNHGILVGVRYNFNQAPPPVVVQPAPVPSQQVARTYLVFFDWDRADLTDRARQIIAEAARATTQVQVTRIEGDGNTDTTGTARYNQGLSVRRAENVAAELVRLGVPRSAITTQGFGFSRLLVPTGPGVREPQNRRVEIILH